MDTGNLKHHQKLRRDNKLGTFDGCFECKKCGQPEKWYDFVNGDITKWHCSNCKVSWIRVHRPKGTTHTFVSNEHGEFSLFEISYD